MQRNNRSRNQEHSHHEKTVHPKKAHLKQLEEALMNNGRAMEEGAKKKSWSIHDLKSIRPLNQAQGDMYQAWVNDYDLCAYGSAGTGKSFLALYLALSDVLNEKTETEKIIIVRSIVSVRDPGHLPGELCEKVAPHEAPYQAIFHELMGKANTYENMKDAGVVEFVTTSFLRGLTWNNAIIVLDESQNMSDVEINSAMTRVGKNSKVMVLGDMKQNDFLHSKKETSGFAQSMRIMEKMSEFALIKFLPQDIVRSGFCKSWILASEELG